MLFVVMFTFNQDGEPAEDAAFDDIVVTPLVNNDVENPVVANVRVLSIGGADSELVFTEPLRGLFSIAPATSACLQGSGCEWSTHNLSTESHSSSPVRVSHAEINGQRQWIISDIGILHPSNDKEGRVVAVNPSTGDTNIIIENIGRTVCAEPGDLDADGDIDLTLC